MRTPTALLALLLASSFATLAAPADACSSEDLDACVPPCPTGCYLGQTASVLWDPDLCDPQATQCPDRGTLYATVTFFARAWTDVPDVTCAADAPGHSLPGPQQCTVVIVAPGVPECHVATATAHAVGPRTGATASATVPIGMCVRPS